MTPAYEPRVARVAAMIADPARSRMLAYLLAGHYASAGELAQAASITAPTASGHLAKLLESGLVADERRGRHRYFKLADADVAHALEALALLAERGTHEPAGPPQGRIPERAARSLPDERAWHSPAREGLRYARCCYGHCAGMLGVALHDSLLRHDRLRTDARGYALTGAGVAWLDVIGLVPRPPRRDQRVAYPCLDWSERRDHLAGSLAVDLLDHFLAKAWLIGARSRTDATGSHRGLRVTPAGEQCLLPLLAD